jgi:hypothetical protein
MSSTHHTPTTTSKAEQLKAEGNALYGSRKYKAAYAKYSEAIKTDPKNAILFANRAACSIEMKRSVLLFLAFS